MSELDLSRLHIDAEEHAPPSTLERADLFRIANMWIEQDAMPLHRPLEIMDALFGSLCDLTRSNSAFAVLSQRTYRKPKLPAHKDPLFGWRAIETITFRGSKSEHQIAEEYGNCFKTYSSDIPTQKLTATSGKDRAFLLDDLLHGDSARGEHTAAPLLEALDFGDRLVGAHAHTSTTELYIGIDRLIGEPRFEIRERDILLQVCRDINTLATRLFMSYGLFPGQKPLTPRERCALHLLLDGASEKEVGAEMNITAASAHQYAVSIYKKLGVNSRSQLLSLWLSPPCCDEL